MALKGNQLWKLRKSHGRPSIFETPEQLWAAACAYFEYVEQNPLKEEKVFASKGKILRTEVSHMQAMTEEGLYLYLGISQKSWWNYCNKETEQEAEEAEAKETVTFREVCNTIKAIIRNQKFTGAAAGLFNPVIIARDLGLKDKQDITSGGEKIKNEWHIHPVTTKKNAED